MANARKQIRHLQIGDQSCLTQKSKHSKPSEEKNVKHTSPTEATWSRGEAERGQSPAIKNDTPEKVNQSGEDYNHDNYYIHRRNRHYGLPRHDTHHSTQLRQRIRRHPRPQHRCHHRLTQRRPRLPRLYQILPITTLKTINQHDKNLTVVKQPLSEASGGSMMICRTGYINPHYECTGK